MNKAACWILGILSGVVLTVGGEAIVLCAVPSKTLLNGFGTTVVGENPGNKGIVPMLLDANTYTVDDFPVIKETLNTLLKEGGLGDLVQIDYEQIKDAKLLDGTISEKLKNAMKVTATLSSLNVNLGDFGKLNMFKQWDEVNPTAAEISAHPAIYYFKDANNKYARAFDDSGNPVSGFSTGTQLYLANLSQIVVTDLFANLSVRIQDLTYREFMINLMGKTEAELNNDQIYKLIGNVKLSELNTVDSNGFLLKDVVTENETNKALFDILADLTGQTKEKITLGMIANIDIKNAKLKTIIAVDSNPTLYRILEDMTGKSSDMVTIKDLDGATVDNIKISTVVASSDNVILKRIIEKETTIGNLGTTISGLSISELFGSNCFTDNASKKVNDDIYYLEGIEYNYSATAQVGKTPYYISQEAGVWLLFAYDAQDIDAGNGRAGRFSPSTVTFNALQNDAAAFATTISNSRVYQLISAGVIQDKPYPDIVKSKTLNDALALI